MSRKKRVFLPGCVVHITHRGNNRSEIFLDDEDRVTGFDLLQTESERTETAVHAHVFMSNHFHLLMTPASRDGLIEMMHAVGSMYARHFNKRYGRTGAFWQGRYHSSLVQSSKYFFACSRYIELNPVRALMVDHPERHVWSSYQHNALGITNKLITPHVLYHDMASSDLGRRNAYRELFRHSIDAETVATIRAGISRNGVVGDAAFREQWARIHKERPSDA